MKYTKFAFALSVCICLVQICYGESLDSKTTIGNKIELTDSSAISIKANENPAINSFKKNNLGVSFGVMNGNGSACDTAEKIKKENDYIKRKVENLDD